MPIKQIEESARPAFPRLGKLRKGGEKTNPKKPGPDLEHFRFTSDRPEIEAAFLSAYGPEPALINAFLPFAVAGDNFSYWQEAWAAGGLLHRCDGETCRLWQREDGTYSTDAVPCPGGCSHVGRLEVIIPELIRAGYVGYVTMETHSKNDILSILGSLMETADKRRGHPDGLKGIMFMLRRVPESISTPPWEPGGPRKRVTKWLVKLEPAADWVRLQLEIAHAGAMGLTSGEILSLPEFNSGEDAEPEPETEDAIEGEILAEEPASNAAKTTTRHVAEQYQVAQQMLEEHNDDPFGNHAFDPDNPTFESYDELYYRAIEHLGYEHMEHAKNALRKITNGEAGELTHKNAWQLLREHQAAKAADEAELEIEKES